MTTHKQQIVVFDLPLVLLCFVTLISMVNVLSKMPEFMTSAGMFATLDKGTKCRF